MPPASLAGCSRNEPRTIATLSRFSYTEVAMRTRSDWELRRNTSKRRFDVLRSGNRAETWFHFVSASLKFGRPSGNRAETSFALTVIYLFCGSLVVNVRQTLSVKLDSS